MISGWIDSDSPGRPKIKQQSCHESRTTVYRRHPAWSILRQGVARARWVPDTRVSEYRPGVPSPRSAR